MFEELIPSIFQGSLDGVTHERRAPPSENATNALGVTDLLPGFHIAFVQIRINLTSTFNQVQRCNGCMCRSLDRGQSGQLNKTQQQTHTSERSANDACCVVFRRI